MIGETHGDSSGVPAKSPTGASQLGSESSEIAGLRVIAFNMRRPFMGAKAATLKADDEQHGERARVVVQERRDWARLSFLRGSFG